MEQPTYLIYHDFNLAQSVTGLAVALDTARKLLADAEPNAATIGVSTDEAYLLAVFTNRRIEGRIVRQVWGGRKGDDAIYVGEDLFDATEAILRMDYQAMLGLDDDDEATDDLGRSHVPWDGPCYVEVVESLCDYFGVSEISHITPEAFAYAQKALPPGVAPIEQTLVVTLQVTIQTSIARDTPELMANLAFSVTTKDSGIVVKDVSLLGTA